MLRNIPEERRSHLYRGGRLKSRNIIFSPWLGNKDSSNRINFMSIRFQFLYIFRLKQKDKIFELNAYPNLNCSRLVRFEMFST